MERLVAIINFLILGLILVSPILILVILKRVKTKQTLFIYSLSSLLILGFLVLISAWWNDEANMILLKHYGYNIKGINEAEHFQNVLSTNIEQVKNIETGIMGIGWPVKAMFGYIMVIPYLLFVYFGKVIIEKIRNNRDLI